MGRLYSEQDHGETAIGRGSCLFANGIGFERFYNTGKGLVLVQSEVVIQGDHLLLQGFTFYPATSARMTLPTGDGTRIFHAIMEDARQEGFTHITLKAFRTHGVRPRRILEIRRTLR